MGAILWIENRQAGVSAVPVAPAVCARSCPMDAPGLPGCNGFTAFSANLLHRWSVYIIWTFTVKEKQWMTYRPFAV
jgi:hypothetical protein